MSRIVLWRLLIEKNQYCLNICHKLIHMLSGMILAKNEQLVTRLHYYRISFISKEPR